MSYMHVLCLVHADRCINQNLEACLSFRFQNKKFNSLKFCYKLLKNDNYHEDSISIPRIRKNMALSEKIKRNLNKNSSL